MARSTVAASTRRSPCRSRCCTSTDAQTGRPPSGQLETLSAELEFDLERRQVDTPADAERLAFRGSPTVLVDGRDPLGDR